ncbi:MAG: hypothetical protein IPH96_13475 [Saprospiraceae bacterium]|nr:hypothetical protein [Saprospiraceae bacterium]
MWAKSELRMGLEEWILPLTHFGPVVQMGDRDELLRGRKTSRLPMLNAWSKHGDHQF